MASSKQFVQLMICIAITLVLPATIYFALWQADTSSTIVSSIALAVLVASLFAVTRMWSTSRSDSVVKLEKDVVIPGTISTSKRRTRRRGTRHEEAVEG